MNRLIFCLFLGLAFASEVLSARADNLDRSTDGDDVKVSISSPYSQLTPGGYVPFRVTIRNDQNAPGTWHMNFQSAPVYPNRRASIYGQSFAVAANSSGTFDILVPMPGSSISGTNTLQVSVTGPGYENTNLHHDYFAYFYINNTNVRCPYTLIGKELLGSVGTGALEKLYKDEKEEFAGSQVDVATLPTDWRGYSGVATIFLKDKEWLALNSAQHDALCNYVAQGGHLTLFTSNYDNSIAELHLPSPEGKTGDYGFGTISIASPDTPDAATLSSMIQNNHAPSVMDTDKEFSNWNLRKSMGMITLSGVFILTFVVIFGTLVGPLNLFVFAAGKKRFRLFWTTPLISIIASLALIIGILITDGVGGKGNQMIAIYSLPASNAEMVIQEQIARTAVLFSNRWANDQNYVLTPISKQAIDSAMDGSGTSGYVSNAPSYWNQTSDSFRQEGNIISGDWFRSRAISGQYLQAILPSRSALTVLNPAAVNSPQPPPTVLSSFPQELTEVYLLDHQGNYWTCGHLQPGNKQTCTATTEAKYNQFWTRATDQAGGKLRPALTKAAGGFGCFYATGIPAASETLAALGEIHWQPKGCVYLGPWVASPTPETTP